MTERTLIIGSGPCAADMARELAARGLSVAVACRDQDTGTVLAQSLKDAAVEVLTGVRVCSCRGAAGDFSIGMDCQGVLTEFRAGSVIVAEEASRAANFSPYGLAAGPCVVRLSDLARSLDRPSGKDGGLLGGRTVAFVHGLARDSHPVVAREVMGAALALQREFGRRTYIFTGNLKVGDDGLEALYQEARAAGTVFVKCTRQRPEIRQAEDGSVVIAYTDEVTRETFTLAPDLTVVDEDVVPAAGLKNLCAVLELECGPDGFCQADNVRRLPVFTNRRGVLVMGPSRGIGTALSRERDMACAAVTLAPVPSGQTVAAGKAVIDPGQCVRCLTCYRVCPYRAVTLAQRPAVAPEACQGCGICVAECPREAISMELPQTESGTGAAQTGPLPESGAFVPAITAFCCSRSAVPARQMTALFGRELPGGLRVVEVPCAGAVSVRHMLAAFGRGADGVMVLGCHPGNCHSEAGTGLSAWRVQQLSGMLGQAGLEAGRLARRTLAANMGAEFCDTVNEFSRYLTGLGPSRLGR